jgi:hypothetical protein
MATATKTVSRTVSKVKPAAAAAEETDTEVKDEPKVVTDQRLGKILKEYNSSEKATGSIWLQIVEYCKENELTREVVKATYIQYRGVQENTALVEVSLIFTACKEENADNLEQALAGDMTVREFRKSIMKPREGKSEADPEKKLILKFKQTSRYAIEKCDMDDPKTFSRMARETFIGVLERYTEQQEETDQSEAGEEEDESQTEE